MTSVAVWIYGNYYRLRRIELTGFPAEYSLVISASNGGGNYNVIEGCNSHHNNGMGFTIYHGAHNIIRDSYATDNSSVGVIGLQGADGNWTDGIMDDGGDSDVIEYCTVERNSDDGVDLWGATNSVVRYTRADDNGRGTGGAGEGIKLGGISPGANNTAYRCLSFNNRGEGFTDNSGRNATIDRCTSWNNGANGAVLSTDTGGDITNNIALENGGHQIFFSGYASVMYANNSTQRAGTQRS